MTKIIQYPIVNKGIVKTKDGSKFVFRSFINQALGWAYLYPLEKNEAMAQFEMELLNKEDRDIPVFIPQAGRAFPVYWDPEGLPEIAIAEINVFTGILMEEMELLDLDDEFAHDHLAMLQVYKRHFDQSEKNKLTGNG